MTNKEIAERLRKLSRSHWSQFSVLAVELADTLDPPRPEPGTVVWCPQERKHGVVRDDGCIEFGQYRRMLSEIDTIKPARILAPDEVAVKVPPVSEWSESTVSIDIQYVPRDYEVHTFEYVTLKTITRAEAERMKEATE